MKRLSYAIPILVIALFITVGLTPTVRAQLTVTAAGTADGFSLSTFVTGFTNNTVGPLGIAVNSDGNVVVDSSFNLTNYVFHDTDGQTVAGAISSTAFNAFPPAYATAAGSVWGSGGFTGPNAGKLVKFNNDGTTNTIYTIPGLSVTNGMWTNPVSGHLLASSESTGQIFDIDVSGVTPTFKLVAKAFADGVTVSPDGTKVYGAVAGGVDGWSIATGLATFSAAVPAADGMGIITSSNSLNGDIVVNTNSGTVVLIDPTTSLQTIIADGGSASRGDYTAADPSNGTLFLTQSGEIDRLACGPGCVVGGPSVPEPSSLLLLGFGLAVLASKALHSKLVSA